MDYLINLIRKINANPISRNLVLAVCAIIVFVFIVNLALNLFTRHGQVHEVPDMKGMSVEEATQAGASASLRIEINDSLYVPAYPGGIILEQNPSAGAKVKSGRRIFVTINSFRQKMVPIPYVTGYSLRQAKNNLEIAGLGIEKLIYRSDLATNYVLEERYDNKVISAGTQVEAEVGSGITLIVGKSADAEAQSIPRVVGFSAREAKSRLWEAGFNVGKISYDEGVNLLNEKDARVRAQSPSPGSRQEYGTSVNFTLSLDEERIEKGRTAAEQAVKAAARAYADSLKKQNSSNP